MAAPHLSGLVVSSADYTAHQKSVLCTEMKAYAIPVLNSDLLPSRTQGKFNRLLNNGFLFQ